MKVLRTLLLLWMGLVVWVMVSYPPLYDSEVRRTAMRQSFEARRAHESAPNPETLRAVEEAKRQVAEAKRLDKKNIMVFELVMFGVLGVSVFAFFLLGRGCKTKVTEAIGSQTG
jgi:predicted alternative tryptophan synthase beta-subunit